MKRSLTTLLALLMALAAPVALASSHDMGDGAAPDKIDVDVDAQDNDPEESTFAGMSTTVVIVLVVLAVLVVALVVALASRGP